ncbi:MAG: cell division protein ZapA [Clostridia bacterium]|nr:cell division protein ZapA [Clostridia bacterium]
MDSKNVIIYVAGQRFSLRTKDTEEYVISTGEQVDLRIKGILNDNPRLNRDSAAILAALDYCDDMRKLSSRVDILREQVKDYLADGEKLRSQNANLKSEIEKLKTELRELKEKKADFKHGQPQTQGKKPQQNQKNTGVPYANPQNRYGVQSFSNTKDPKPENTKTENFHQFSIFDKDIK